MFLLLLLLLRRTNVIETIAPVIASNSWIVRLQRHPPPTHPTTIVVTQTTYFIHSFLSFLIYGNSIEFRNYRMQTLNIVLIPKGERKKRAHCPHTRTRQWCYCCCCCCFYMEAKLWLFKCDGFLPFAYCVPVRTCTIRKQNCWIHAHLFFSRMCECVSMRPRSRFMYEWRHMLPISDAFFLLFIFHSFCAYEKSRHCTNIIKCCIDSYKLRYILLSYDVRDQFSISSKDVKRDVCVNVSMCESYIFFNYPIHWKVSWIHTHMLGFSIVLCYIYSIHVLSHGNIYMRNPIEHRTHRIEFFSFQLHFHFIHTTVN